MGNCQAIDNASLVIQYQNGRVERLYSPISAAQVMKLNPGHYVALLLTTTLYSSRPSTTTSIKQNHHSNNNSIPAGGATTNNQPLRITRIKLLRPTDNLALGHVYRLITTQEVRKGLSTKKNGKMNHVPNKLQPESSSGNPESILGRQVVVTRSNQPEKTHHQMKKPDNHQPRTAAPANSSTAGVPKPKGWHPSLKSISEATS